MKKWFVYILRCSDNSLYTGITINLNERLKDHNSGKGAKYTRSRLPVVYVWSESVKNESKARKREAELKNWPKTKKETLIRS